MSPTHYVHRVADLFEHAAAQPRQGDPLAERMRPTTLDDVVGQKQLLAHGKILRRLTQNLNLPSMILWGPPGTGKTTLAKILAQSTQASFESLSAVMAGVAELRKVLGAAKNRREFHRKKTILFVDEIHRWSKSQQDGLLDAVERGIITLIGATTENPSFELNSALLSRVRVFVLEPLCDEDLEVLIKRALSDNQRGFGYLSIDLNEEAKTQLITQSHGDARQLLTTLDIAVQAGLRQQNENNTQETITITRDEIEQAQQHKTLLYDKAGDEHYGVVSAFIKSMRGSDPDAAVYYLTRMLEGGEDPRFILRRLLIFASEDIGLADSNALQVATSAAQAYDYVGMPEGVLVLSHATLYMAKAPKSNTALKSYAAARKLIRSTGPLAVPKKLLNATTSLQKKLGHGTNYKYPHDLGGFVPEETYLPDSLVGTQIYPGEPSENSDADDSLLDERSENLDSV